MFVVGNVSGFSSSSARVKADNPAQSRFKDAMRQAFYKKSIVVLDVQEVLESRIHDKHERT